MSMYLQQNTTKQAEKWKHSELIFTKPQLHQKHSMQKNKEFEVGKC